MTGNAPEGNACYGLVCDITPNSVERHNQIDMLSRLMLFEMDHLPHSLPLCLFA